MEATDRNERDAIKTEGCDDKRSKCGEKYRPGYTEDVAYVTLQPCQALSVHAWKKLAFTLENLKPSPVAGFAQAQLILPVQ